MTDLTGKKIILTGATGFIGRYMAQELLNAGAEVYAVVRPDSPNAGNLPKEKGLNILSCDLEHIKQTYREFVNDANPPFAFLHFAWGGVNRGEIDTDEVQQKNIDLSLACLDAAIQLGCKVFMDAGSRVEYGITEDGVMEEHMICSPVNAYGRAKLKFFEEASAICREHDITYYHLRFFSVYGVGDHPWSIISTLCRDLPLGKTVPLSACEHHWNFMHVRDAAAAVGELLKHSDTFTGQVNTVNVAGSDTRVLKSFVEEIYEICLNNRSQAGTPEYGTFEQAKEGALSVCPVINELNRLTEGNWHERVSFAQGIMELINSNTG